MKVEIWQKFGLRIYKIGEISGRTLGEKSQLARVQSHRENDVKWRFYRPWAWAEDGGWLLSAVWQNEKQDAPTSIHVCDLYVVSSAHMQ